MSQLCVFCSPDGRTESPNLRHGEYFDNRDYLNKNPIEGLRLPLDKRPRQAKPTITPEQFNALLELVQEPYATMLYVAVWTALRVSELIGLKWRCIHGDAITVEERYCRGDWSQPKTAASAATLSVSPEVITRIRLKTLTVDVRAGLAKRKYKLVKSDNPDALVFQSVKDGAPTNDQNILKRHIQPAALSENIARDLVGAGGSRSEIGAGTQAAFAHLHHNGNLRTDRA